MDLLSWWYRRSSLHNSLFGSNIESWMSGRYWDENPCSSPRKIRARISRGIQKLRDLISSNFCQLFINLQALPDEMNFGSVEHGQPKKLCFHLFNFSSVKINYKLTCNHRGWPVGDPSRDVEIQPVVETIHPGSKERIDVCVTPREAGFYQLAIRYSVRPNSLAIDATEMIQPRDICTVNCMCVLPGFEVIEIRL